MYLNKTFSFWKIFTMWFITLMPFYYAPFLFISDVHGAEWEFFRIAKDYVILIVIIVWFFYIIKNKLKGTLNNLTSIFVFIYIIHGLTKISSYDNLEVVVEVARIYVLFPIWFFVAKSLYTTSNEVRLQLNRWVLASLFVSVIAVSEWLFFGGDNVYSRAAGQTRSISTLFSPNALGWYLAAMNSVLLGLIRFSSNSPNNAKDYFSYPTALLLLLINTTAILISGSRSALFVNIFIFSLWLLTMLYRREVAIISVILVLLGFIFYFTIPSESALIELRVFGGSETTRSDIYTEMIQSYWSMGFLDILFGLDGSEYSNLKQSALLDDSYFLTVVASGGIVSVFIFIFIIITGVVRYISLSNYLSPERKSMFYLLLTCCILGLIGNLQGVFPLAIFFWVSAGMLIQMSTHKIKNLNST